MNIQNVKCDEVVNFIKIDKDDIETRPNYIMIRCLRKNYAKKLEKFKSSEIIVEEALPEFIVNPEINIMKNLKKLGFKTFKNNGIFVRDHIRFAEIIQSYDTHHN